MNKLKQKIWDNKEMIVAILLVLTLIITGSYAWIRLRLDSTKQQVIKAGSLKLVLDESMSDGILLENAIPMSDRKGLETVEYTFSLSNNGTTNSAYTIYLNDLPLEEGQTRMTDNNVKYSLVKDEGAPRTEVLSNLVNRSLDTGTLAPNSTIRYSLRVWINSDARTDVMGTIFYSNLRIDTSQTA